MVRQLVLWAKVALYVGGVLVPASGTLREGQVAFSIPGTSVRLPAWM